ncbi:unnamed protein product [Ixodes pacificus]
MFNNWMGQSFLTPGGIWRFSRPALIWELATLRVAVQTVGHPMPTKQNNTLPRLTNTAGVIANCKNKECNVGRRMGKGGGSGKCVKGRSSTELSAGVSPETWTFLERGALAQIHHRKKYFVNLRFSLVVDLLRCTAMTKNIPRLSSPPTKDILQKAQI